MPSNWDLAEFITLVQSKIGTTQADAMLPALQSIPSKFEFCHYHRTQAISLMRPNKTATDPFTQMAEGMRILTLRNEETEKFVQALFGARAHTVAFAQSLHATADLLAKVIYRGLDLPTRHGISLSNTQIGLKRINDQLPAVAELAAVHAKIIDYLSSGSFRYLAAFVNTEKHHEIIDARYSFSVSIGAVASAGIELVAFSYNGASFPKKWASEFFEQEFDDLLERTASVGSALNDYLRTLPLLPSSAPPSGA